MTFQLRTALIKTIFYSDIFDYPLTAEEIHIFLVGFRTSMPEVSKSLKSINVFKEKNGFYCLKGKEKNINLRIKKEKISRKKISYAKKIAGLLFFFPFVKVIALTGNLAMLASSNDDDIDFLLITAGNRTWLARFFCVLFLKILGIYRKPNEKKSVNKICLNMYMSEDNLLLPENERDLFSAHEIVQAKTLFSRPGCENILISSNPWIKKYLPNISVIPSVNEESRTNVRNPFSSFFDLLENILKNFQLFYMQKKRTTEVIRNGYLRFHPQDARKYILHEYQQKLKRIL